MGKHHNLKLGLLLPLDDFHRARSQTLRAEESGFYAVAAEDHFFMTGLLGTDRFSNRLECFTLLSALSTITRRVVLTQLVAANSFRHPALTAKIISSLHHITGGRVELGIGAGWFRAEYEAFGFPYPAPAERIAQLEEALVVIKRLWREEEVSFAGQYYRLERAPHCPKPDPLPRVMVGGGGRRILELAAREAEIVNIIPPTAGAVGHMVLEDTLKFDLRAFAARIAILRAACARIGRDFEDVELSAMVYVVLGNTPAQAQMLAQGMAQTLGLGDVQAIYQSPNTLVGSPEQVAEEILRRRAELGVTYFFCNFAVPEMFEQFCQKVMPRLL